MKIKYVILSVTAMLFSLNNFVIAQNRDWSSYAADKYNSKYSSLDQINKDNVKDLGIVWEWESPDNALMKTKRYPISIYQTTPLAINGVLYISSSLGTVSAVNGKTGETIWKYDPEVYNAEGKPAHGGFMHRGVSYWDDGKDGRIVFGTLDGRLIAISAKDGKPVETFGNKGIVDLTKGLSRTFAPGDYSVPTPPIIANGVIVVGSSITDAGPKSMKPPGDVRGFDVKTGKQLWTFHTIPHEGEFGYDTWEKGSAKIMGNTNVWTRMSADEELGYVYLPVSTPTNDWYGGDRPGDNVFAESLVCLNIKTGERIWHFQAVHHGVWDYDLASAPNLMDITVKGKPVKAVAQLTKQGFVFVFDRVTGEPIWPIEERPVPQSKVEGERTSLTQPFPTKPAPYERQGITKEDIIDFTPELKERAWESLANVDKGELFTPPTERGLMYLPGALGGANWHGAAVDPETGMLYIPSITYPVFFKVVKADPEKTDAKYDWDNFRIVGPEGLPLLKPPYGRITAIDINTGDHKWQVAMGNGPRNHPMLKDMDLPRLGWQFRGSPLLTKTLLFVGQEGRFFDFVPALVGSERLKGVPPVTITKFEPKMQVFNKDNGELIAEVELPLNVTGAPMTYMIDGKQYIAFAVGGTVISPAKIIAIALK
ncbi:pyrroloquinoline quinone-dependent dehydrogenase [Pontimicrobium sp. MEBiC06410]